MEVLLDYPWPGNVRELIHVVEPAAGTARGKAITPVHLLMQNSLRAAMISASASVPDEILMITEALQATKGNVTVAARSLGISRSTLYRRMRRLGEK